MKLDTSPEALAEELLGRAYSDLDEEEQRALSRVMSSDIELDPDEEEVVRARLGDPYIFLNLMLSTVAALQAPIIMMSQNRQARKDRISNRHDYEVNLRTTVEILLLHRKIDKVFNKLGQLHGDVQEVPSRTAIEVSEAQPAA